MGCETEAERRKERLDRLAQTIEARLSAADLPTVPHGERWSAAEVRVIVGETIAVDRAANALELYAMDPDGYAESARPIPEVGPEVLELPGGGIPARALSSGGTLPALAAALRPPAGRGGDDPESEGVPPLRGPLDLDVGSKVPYRTFAAVLRTVVQERFTPRLVARGPRSMVQLPVLLPAIPAGCRSADCIEALVEPRAASAPDASTAETPDDAPTRLDLTIAIGEDGVNVFGSGGVLARGCERIQRPGDESNSVPRRSGTIDRGALEACLNEVADVFLDDDVVLIQPEPAIPFNEVIIVASIAYGDDRFPELLFAAPE